MKQTRLIMGMPITIEIVDEIENHEIFDQTFALFDQVDAQFSPYKETSELYALNRGELTLELCSLQMRQILSLCDITKKETFGYFDIHHQGKLDPCGLVKGWAIREAANFLDQAGFANYFVEAGGDIQVKGKNKTGQVWSIGVRNPLQKEEIVKVLYLGSGGVATSGTYERGQHIYNPFDENCALDEVLSLTVIGPDVYEADRFATAAFAMQRDGIEFIESLPQFEGYMIDRRGIATMTSGLRRYTEN